MFQDVTDEDLAAFMQAMGWTWPPEADHPDPASCKYYHCPPCDVAAQVGDDGLVCWCCGSSNVTPRERAIPITNPAPSPVYETAS